jgi:hypothetical protein
MRWRLEGVTGTAARLTQPTLACLAIALATGACSSVTLPHDPQIAALQERRIVVLVPGVTGVELVDPASGKVGWGRGKNLIAPRDGGHALAIALAPPGAGAPSSVDLVPGRVIERIRLGPITKPVYGPIVRLMLDHGWTRGDLEATDSTANFFLFAYDWRRDNSVAANQLAQRLEDLARARGEGGIDVSLICQSNGAHVCRFLAKYGRASLAEAERGETRPLDGVDVEQLILVGNANGGSLRMLRFLNSGRKYVTGIGRKFHPETFFTFEALFQDLPAYKEDLFVDEDGRPLTVDLYDVESWRRFGWSVYADGATRRLAKNRRPDLFVDAQGRAAHLEASLELSRRLHTVLEQDVAVGATRYFLIQNTELPTPDRAVLRRTDTGWETLVTGDKKLRKLTVADQVATRGDGHATIESQQWLSPSERAAFAGEPFYVDGAHFEMILETATLQRLLEILGQHPDGP